MGVPRLLAGALCAAAFLVAPAAASAVTPSVWLCKPGIAKNPCAAPLTTTVIRADGGTSVVRRKAAAHPAVDCFYVYPTVSGQDRVNATLKVDPEETAIAQYQASRYSQTCRVYAPMYRQLTLRAINAAGGAGAAAQRLAYGDVRDAWREYLRRDNHGRGVLLLGHSQGTFMLRRLIREEIDRKVAVRRLLVAAHLLGGDVLVRKGSDRGGDFRNVPACRSDRQTGCVVAYSTFNTTPPKDSLFGRTTEPGMKVLCTNPGALGGGSAQLDSFNRTTPFPGLLGVAVAQATVLPTASTPWVEYPDRSVARCTARDGAVWLDVQPTGGAADRRPLFTPVPTPEWGLHLGDINLAYGQLTDLASAEVRAYLDQRGA